MSKLSASALVKLQEIVNSGKIIQIEQRLNSVEVIVFDGPGLRGHRHYPGKNIIERFQTYWYRHKFLYFHEITCSCKKTI